MTLKRPARFLFLLLFLCKIPLYGLLFFLKKNKVQREKGKGGGDKRAKRHEKGPRRGNVFHGVGASFHKEVAKSSSTNIYKTKEGRHIRNKKKKKNLEKIR